jgi:hypothetical protein
MIISLILIFIAGACKAVMDTLAFHYSVSRFSILDPLFWNPALSWKNKYSNPNTLKPKFFGSTTLFVCFMDGWHFFQMAFLSCMFMGLVLYTPLMDINLFHVPSVIWNFIILRLLFGASFEVFFSWFLLK